MPHTSKSAISLRKLMHRPLVNIFKMMLEHRINLIRDESINNGKPTIYIATHVMYDDIVSICYCLKENAYILFGQQAELRKTSLIDCLGLFLNGRVLVKRYDRVDRARSKVDMAKVLDNRGNILAFCEGTWNFSPNQLVLPLSWGVLEAAKLISTDPNIVPVAFDMIEDEYYVIIGKNLEIHSMTDFSKSDFMRILRDEIASLVWELYEMKPVVKRDALSKNLEIEWVAYIKEHCAEIKVRDQHKEDNYVYRPKGEVSLGEVLAGMHGVEYRSMAADYVQYQQINKLVENWTRLVKFQ